MRSTKGAFLALTVLGGYFVWRNRFAIQEQLESLGIKTPTLKGDSLVESAKSIASKASGKFEHGATIAEHAVKKNDTSDRKVSNY